MINGEKLPYEEYVLDIHKMVLLEDAEQVIVARAIDKRIEQLKAERNISYEDAKRFLLGEYKKMRDANMLPRHYLVDTDPEFFEKMLLFAAHGARDIPVLTEAEYDRRKAFTLDYMENSEAI